MKDDGTERGIDFSNATIVEIKDLYPQYLEAENQKTICRFTKFKIYWVYSNMRYLYKLEYRIRKRKQASNKCQLVNVNNSLNAERDGNTKRKKKTN